MMNHCVVPNWDLERRSQEGEDKQADERGNRSSHVASQHENALFPLPDYEFTELAWENGSVAMHGLGPASAKKLMWTQAGDTLESLVHQATNQCNRNSCSENKENHNTVQSQECMTLHIGSSSGKRTKKSTVDFTGPVKQSRSDLSPRQSELEKANCTSMTWASFESKLVDDDSACPSDPTNLDEEMDTRKDSERSNSTRRSRAADVHNQSERRRRDRINQKMKALMRLVPNSCKKDKASILDEVIKYLKQLQAQIEVMKVRNMSPVMMPLGIHQLQMPLMSRVGMGMGMVPGLGMGPCPSAPQTVPPILHHASSSDGGRAASSSFGLPPMLFPHMMPHLTTNANINLMTSSLPDPYTGFLQQTMNVDLYKQMAALYSQQLDQAPQLNSNAAVPHGH